MSPRYCSPSTTMSIPSLSCVSIQNAVAFSSDLNQITNPNPAHLLGKIGHHVAAVLLTIDNDVDPELVLRLHPECGRLLFLFLQYVRRDLTLSELGAEMHQRGRLRKAADRCCGQ